MEARSDQALGEESDEIRTWEAGLSRPLRPSEIRLIGLLEEFRRRQRVRPDLAVRPWWSPGEAGASGQVGFVVEYCPDGRSSAELAVRRRRVTVEGPRGAKDVDLALDSGWFLGDLDTGSPETLANHLLRLADRVLEDAA